MELSFCDLRAKEVVNMCDGSNMGNIIDLIFDTTCARITGLVVVPENVISDVNNNPSILNFLNIRSNYYIHQRIRMEVQIILNHM